MKQLSALQLCRHVGTCKAWASHQNCAQGQRQCHTPCSWQASLCPPGQSIVAQQRVHSSNGPLHNGFTGQALWWPAWGQCAVRARHWRVGHATELMVITQACCLPEALALRSCCSKASREEDSQLCLNDVHLLRELPNEGLLAIQLRLQRSQRSSQCRTQRVYIWVGPLGVKKIMSHFREDVGFLF
jgi:hypothetical protein